MKTLKLAILPATLLATSAFAHEVVVDEVVVAEPVAVSTTTYNPENGVIKNTTTQLVEGTKTFFNKATKPAVISAEAGTLGYGGHIAWGVNEKTDLVAGWNGGELDFDVDIDDDSIINWNKVLDDKMQDFKGNIAFKADMNNPYLGVKLRPWGNNFNLNTGVIFNDNKFTADFTNQTTYEYTIKGVKKEVVANSSISVEAEQKNSVSPYLTLGFSPSINKRWGVFGEVGVAYTGDLKTKVSHKVPENTPEEAEQKVVEVADDVRKEIQDANIKFHPIVKAGVTVRF